MSVLTRAEVKAHLVISTDAHDAQMSRVGPLVPTTKTESHGAALTRRRYPGVGAHAR